ncbi:Tetratricopeptide repeat protein 16, partial [Irineochytrium annulatum]
AALADEEGGASVSEHTGSIMTPSPGIESAAVGVIPRREVGPPPGGAVQHLEPPSPSMSPPNQLEKMAAAAAEEVQMVKAGPTIGPKAEKAVTQESTAPPEPEPEEATVEVGKTPVEAIVELPVDKAETADQPPLDDFDFNAPPPPDWLALSVVEAPPSPKVCIRTVFRRMGWGPDGRVWIDDEDMDFVEEEEGEEEEPTEANLYCNSPRCEYVGLGVFGKTCYFCHKGVLVRSREEKGPDRSERRAAWLFDHQYFPHSDQRDFDTGPQAFGMDLLRDQAVQNNQKGLECLFHSKAPQHLALAIASFSRAVYLDPEEPTYYFHRGEAALRVNDFETAIANFKRSYEMIRKQTDHVSEAGSRPTVGNAVHHLRVKDPSVWINRRLRRVCFLWGQILMDERRFPEALAQFETAKGLGMNLDSVLIRMVATHIGMNAIDEAFEILYILTERNPNNCDLFILRAKLYREQENIDFMHMDLQRAMKINPAHPEVMGLLESTMLVAIRYKNKASEQILKGQFDLAIYFLNHALELDPMDWVLLFKRGVLFAEIGHYDSAIADLTTVLDACERDEIRREDDIKAHLASVYNKLDCYLRGGDVQKALNDLTRAVELDATDMDTRHRIGTIRYQKGETCLAAGDIDGAIVEFSKAISADSSRSLYYFERARSFLMHQMIDASRADLVACLKLEPMHREAQAMLSNLTSGPSFDQLAPFPKPHKPVSKLVRSKIRDEPLSTVLPPLLITNHGKGGPGVDMSTPSEASTSINTSIATIAIPEVVAPPSTTECAQPKSSKTVKQWDLRWMETVSIPPPRVAVFGATPSAIDVLGVLLSQSQPLLLQAGDGGAAKPNPPPLHNERTLIDLDLSPGEPHIQSAPAEITGDEHEIVCSSASSPSELSLSNSVVRCRAPQGRPDDSSERAESDGLDDDDSEQVNDLDFTNDIDGDGSTHRNGIYGYGDDGSSVFDRETINYFERAIWDDQSTRQVDYTMPTEGRVESIVSPPQVPLPDVSLFKYISNLLKIGSGNKRRGRKPHVPKDDVASVELDHSSSRGRGSSSLHYDDDEEDDSADEDDGDDEDGSDASSDAGTSEHEEDAGIRPVSEATANRKAPKLFEPDPGMSAFSQECDLVLGRRPRRMYGPLDGGSSVHFNPKRRDGRKRRSKPYYVEVDSSRAESLYTPDGGDSRNDSETVSELPTRTGSDEENEEDEELGVDISTIFQEPSSLGPLPNFNFGPLAAHEILGSDDATGEVESTNVGTGATTNVTEELVADVQHTRTEHVGNNDHTDYDEADVDESSAASVISQAQTPQVVAEPLLEPIADDIFVSPIIPPIPPPLLVIPPAISLSVRTNMAESPSQSPSTATPFPRRASVSRPEIPIVFLKRGVYISVAESTERARDTSISPTSPLSAVSSSSASLIPPTSFGDAFGSGYGAGVGSTLGLGVLVANLTGSEYTSYAITARLLRPDIRGYHNQCACNIVVLRRYRELRKFYFDLMAEYQQMETEWPTFPQKTGFEAGLRSSAEE